VEIEANQHIIHLAANKYPFKLILKTDFNPPAEHGAVKRTAGGEVKSAKAKMDYNHWSHGLLGGNFQHILP
jgi:hypothetical protein